MVGRSFGLVGGPPKQLSVGGRWSVGGKVVTKLASERKKRENENTCHRCVERKKVRDRPGKGGIEREVVLLLIAFERVQEAGILSRLVWK